MKSGMIIIEVLISLLILFMVVVTSVTTIKHLNTVQAQQVQYGDVYMALINVKNYISADICQRKRLMSGTFNDFRYIARCVQEDKKRTYVAAFEIGGPQGNIGKTMAILSKVTVTLKKNNFQKKYSYQKFTTKKVF